VKLGRMTDWKQSDASVLGVGMREYLSRAAESLAGLA